MAGTRRVPGLQRRLPQADEIRVVTTDSLPSPPEPESTLLLRKRTPTDAWFRTDHLHRGHRVFPLFCVELGHSQQQLIFLDSEFGSFSHRQQYRVFLITRMNAIHHLFGLQHILLAEHRACLLMSTVGA